MKKLLLALGLCAVYSAPAFAVQISQAEVLTTLQAINEHEINAAKLASDKKISDKVEDYAEMLEKQHGKNYKDTASLSKKLKLTLEDTPAVNKMRSEGQAELMALNALEGAVFEKAYIEAMVKGHKQALDKLDKTLIPSANNRKLKRHLMNTRGHIMMHYEKAKQIQAGK